MSLEIAIKKTINYADKFGSKITEKEITERLISNKIYPDKEINNLSKKEKLGNIINPWKLDKLLKAKDLGKLLKNNFNNILFLGVSGSVASGHPKENDDIDLVLITKRNKLWLTRFWLRISIFLNKIPHRKYGQKEMKDDFCFNLWLDEDGLKLPINKQTLQSANDLIMMIPIFNKQGIYEKLLLENDWVKKYLATGFYRKTKDIRIKKKDLRIRQNIIKEIINKLFFWPQYWYMKKRMTSEKINYHQAFFYK